MSSLLNTEEIKKIIPHRYPMLLLDKVFDLKPGQSASSIHNVSFSEPFVYASENNTFPFLLLVETMAQTGAVALLSKDDFKGKTAYFGAINKADFYEEAKPGDQITVKTELTKIRRNIGIGVGEAFVGEKLIAKATLTFMIG